MCSICCLLLFPVVVGELTHCTSCSLDPFTRGVTTGPLNIISVKWNLLLTSYNAWGKNDITNILWTTRSEYNFLSKRENKLLKVQLFLTHCLYTLLCIIIKKSKEDIKNIGFLLLVSFSFNSLSPEKRLITDFP